MRTKLVAIVVSTIVLIGCILYWQHHQAEKQGAVTLNAQKKEPTDAILK